MTFRYIFHRQYFQFTAAASELAPMTFRFGACFAALCFFFRSALCDDSSATRRRLGSDPVDRTAACLAAAKEEKGGAGRAWECRLPLPTRTQVILARKNGETTRLRERSRRQRRMEVRDAQEKRRRARRNSSGTAISSGTAAAASKRERDRRDR